MSYLEKVFMWNRQYVVFDGLICDTIVICNRCINYDFADTLIITTGGMESNSRKSTQMY